MKPLTVTSAVWNLLSMLNALLIASRLIGNDVDIDVGIDRSPTEDTDKLVDFLIAPAEFGGSISATPAPLIPRKRLLRCTRE